MQIAGLGVAGSLGMVSQTNAQESPNRLEIVALPGGTVDYSFTTTGSLEMVQNSSFASSNAGEESVSQNDDGTWTAAGHTEDGYGDSYLYDGDVIDFQPPDGDFQLYLNGSRITTDQLVVKRRHRLEIRTPSDGSVEYAMRTSGEITKILDNGDLSSESNDTVVQNDDGTWSVTGLTGNGYGDTLEFVGEALEFSPKEGSFSLYLDGTQVTPYELIGQEEPSPTPTEDREHSYSFESTGRVYADYFLEVESGGNMIASEKDGAVIEDEFHWISDDGTKAAGRVHPGQRHAFEFDNLVLDVTIEGQAAAYVDGSPSSVDRYPQPGATGDDWKSGFPWEDTEYELGIRSTDDTPGTYYEFTSGREVTPGTDTEGHDTLSNDGDIWTVNGAFGPNGDDSYIVRDKLQSWSAVDSSGNTVDDSRFGLFWDGRAVSVDDIVVGGEPEPTEDSDTTTRSGEPLGGGDGYTDIIQSADADYTVSSLSGLESALSSASSGDVVFVTEDIYTGGTQLDVPAGVTLAGDRGLSGSAGALLYTDDTPQVQLRPEDGARITGLRLRGPSPGQTVSYDDGISFDDPTYAIQTDGNNVEVDNCEIWGFPDRGIYCYPGSGAHVHHNYIYDCNGQGLGYGVAIRRGEATIEYNYFNNTRHAVTCDYSSTGYIARYNHFGPKNVKHIADVHDPFEGDTTIDSNIFENDLSRTWDNNPVYGIGGYSSGGFNGGSLRVTDNWFFRESTDFFHDFSEVTESGNVYGLEGSQNPSDVIPDHPGLSDRPWA